MSELKYWVWLASMEDVRYRVKNLLLEHYGGVSGIYFSRPADNDAVTFLNDVEREALANKDLSGARRIIDECAEHSIAIVTKQDAIYPNRLSAIYDPPLVLYVRGRLPNIDDMCAVAVVGTRSATPYGLKMAKRMGYDITRCGGLVISGLTRGVDAAAAEGAMEAGGGCVGVLGTAIDDDSTNTGICADTAFFGALVSEYPPGAPTHSSNFRARNRVTSGLAVATLVVEAPAKSGALLFADEALNQGREVFAVPGNADAVNSVGTNRLIMEGAQPALSAWDVLSGYAARFENLSRSGKRRYVPEQPLEMEADNQPSDDASEAGSEDAQEKQKKRGKKNPLKRLWTKKDIDKPEDEEYIDLKKQLSELNETQLAIVSAITEKSTHIDDIIERTSLPAAQVLGELTMLQIKGYVSQEPGKRFSLNISQK